MRKVKMYNACFGDCFVIHDDSNNQAYRELVVDCGVHHMTVPFRNSMTMVDADQRIKEITDDLIACHQHADLLITHFHYDHISGLSYLYSLGTGPMAFSDVYLPNIWQFPFVVAATILQNLMVKRALARAVVPSIIPRRFIGLLPLLNSFSASAQNIHFLKRGDTFRNSEFMTLLPDDDVMRRVEREYEELQVPDDLRRNLDSFARQMCNIVIERTGDGQAVVTAEALTGAFQGLEAQYEELEGRVVTGNDDIDNWFNSDAEDKLNKLGNKISIVFQNNDDGENMLFTGDAEKRDLNRIKPLTDIPMHDHYKYIKLPHHGTQSHYTDFSAYSPEWVLIPNGKTTSMGGGLAQISADYGSLGANKMCSNSNFCESCASGRCTTTPCPGCGAACTAPCTSGKNIVFPNLYRDV